MRPLISVIIPVYKSEKYLRECVDSVKGQTYSNIEIILVDDGSPDECPAICDDYALIDQRCKVIHKENGGVSSARNAGLEEANGEYICFVDSDDTLISDGIEKLYKAICKYPVEYVVGMCIVKETGKPKKEISDEEYIDITKNRESFLKHITESGSYSPYAKLYAANIINANNIRFDTRLKCSEDALFIREYLCYCKGILLIPEHIYEYTSTNQNSLSKRRYVDYCLYYEEKLKVLEKLCDNINCSDDEKRSFLTYRAVHGLRLCVNHYMSHWENEKDQRDLIQRSIVTINNWIQDDFGRYNKADVSLSKWWKNKRNHLQNENFDGFFYQVKKENKRMVVKQLIKRILIKLFR